MQNNSKTSRTFIYAYTSDKLSGLIQPIYNEWLIMSYKLSYTKLHLRQMTTG